jgi:hypothetical protein
MTWPRKSGGTAPLMTVPASPTTRALADGATTFSGPTRRAGSHLEAPQSWRLAPSTSANGGTGQKPGANTSGVLLAAASVLLAGLAVAMGVVSWHAQYAFIFSVKHQRPASALEALGLDCGAVVFSLLGVALARLGRRAVIERALVCICAAWWCAMNAADADLASPRSIGAFVMPPVLFAITSDRLVSVIRRNALGPAADAEAQQSAWRTGGLAVLYALRLAVAPASTIRGGRVALLEATPVPSAATAVTAAEVRYLPAPERARNNKPARNNGPSKADQLIRLADQRHNLADIPVERVSRLATELASEIGYHPGTARRVLLAHVRRLQGITPATTTPSQDGA